MATVKPISEEFALTLRAANKSIATQRVYLTAVVQLAAFLEARGMPSEAAHLHREHVEAFLADLLDRRSPATAKTRHGGLAVFFGWLVETGELERSPMERLRPPIVPE